MLIHWRLSEDQHDSEKTLWAQHKQHPNALLDFLLGTPPPRFCDIVIYNMKCIFGVHPHFWHRAPKTLGTLVGEQQNSLLLCE